MPSIYFMGAYPLEIYPMFNLRYYMPTAVAGVVFSPALIRLSVCLSVCLSALYLKKPLQLRSPNWT